MRIPKLARLMAEDYKDQSKWITKLIGPLNSYFEFINQALTKGLTLTDNMSAAVKTVEVDGTYPVKMAWELSSKPVAVLVGGLVRSDGAAVTLTNAVQVQWQYNQAGQLQIDAVTGGLTINVTNKYKINLVCFTG